MKYEGKIYGKVAGKYIELENVKDDTEMLKSAVEILSDLYDLQNGPPLQKHKDKWVEVMKAADNFLKEMNL